MRVDAPAWSWSSDRDAEAEEGRRRQCLELPALIARKAMLWRLACRAMASDIRDGVTPVHRLRVEVVVADKRAPIEEALAAIADRPLDFAFGLGAVRPTGARAKAPVLGKAEELAIHDEAARVLAIIRGYHGPHLICSSCDVI